LDSALLLRRALLERNVDAEIDYEPRSFKAQLRAADRKGARFALILGEDEVARGLVTWKDLRAGTQELISREEAVNRTAAGAGRASD
jgi:histidyl-tRNA synthetase